MTRRTLLTTSLLASAGIALLGGCGANSGQGQVTAGSKLAEAQACIACHPSPASPGTGLSIVTEWKASVHNTRDGAGCRDCHEPINHPASDCARCHNGSTLSGADEIQRNPDRSGKCLKCHNGQNAIDPTGFDLGYHGSTVNGVASNGLLHAGISMNTQRAHFNALMGAYTTGKYPGVNDAAPGEPKIRIDGYPATYVTTKYLYTKNANGTMKTEGQCRKCHNPHDPTSDILYNRDYSRSAHGMTGGIPARFSNRLRYLGRVEYDLKQGGGDLPASQAMSDVYAGKYEVCVRCHTTTGFIKYINSGYTDLKTFGVPGEITSISDLYQAANNPAHPLNAKYTGKFNTYRADISPEKSREVTGCNACHDNGNDSAYKWSSLRKVPQVTSYYNYGPNTLVGKSRMAKDLNGTNSAENKYINFGVKFPDVGASNMCVSCHSGRTIGINIKMADARQLTYTSSGQGKFDPHFKGSSLLVLRPTYNGKDIGGAGFEFYSSGSTKLQNYDSIQFSHDLIGTTTTRTVAGAHVDGSNGKSVQADPRLLGPCVGCHLNLKDELKTQQTSHTFLPINRDASATYYNEAIVGKTSEPITSSVSKACAKCHHGTEWDEFAVDVSIGGITTYNRLEIQRMQFKAAFKAFQRLLIFATNVNATGATTSVPSPTDWYGARGNASGLQPWLRTATAPGRPVPAGGLPYYVSDNSGNPLNLFDDPILGLTPLRNATYTIGAFYNYNLFDRDPGSYAHNRRYVKRLIFDSMDWVDDGKLNKSVCDSNPANHYTRSDNSRKFMNLNTYGTGLTGATGNLFTYASWGLTADELKQASYYLCGSIAKTYNGDGTIATFTADHRPAP